MCWKHSLNTWDPASMIAPCSCCSLCILWPWRPMESTELFVMMKESVWDDLRLVAQRPDWSSGQKMLHCERNNSLHRLWCLHEAHVVFSIQERTNLCFHVVKSRLIEQGNSFHPNFYCPMLASALQAVATMSLFPALCKFRCVHVHWVAAIRLADHLFSLSWQGVPKKVAYK